MSTKQYTSDYYNNTYTLQPGDNSSYTIDWVVDPDSILIQSEIEEMCKFYPGLKKSWDNFNIIYNMCKHDYKNKRNKP